MKTTELLKCLLIAVKIFAYSAITGFFIVAGARMIRFLLLQVGYGD